MLSVPRPSPAAVEVNERFIERAIRQEMLQPRGKLAAMGLMPRENLFGHRSQRFQMRGRIAVAEGVVGDRFLAAAEQGGEVVVHADAVARNAAAGNCGIDAAEPDG